MIRLEFTLATMEAANTRADGKCEHCGLPFNGERPEYHHITEAWLGGDNSLENCLCVHKRCHKWLTRNVSTKRIAKTKHMARSAAGIKRKFNWPKRKFGQ